MKVPLIGICRHRLNTDGQGVTTLVAFHGCPLRCKYCLNAQCMRGDGIWQKMSVEDILDEVKADDLYFRATNGGVTFGGGEPLLRHDEIVSFCRICPKEWRINIETALNVELVALQTVEPYIDHYYIDIKDMNPRIYHRYTSQDNGHVLENLHWLAEHIDLSKVTIRLPHIPHFNTLEEMKKSKEQLEAMGFRDFVSVEYIIPNERR